MQLPDNVKKAIGDKDGLEIFSRVLKDARAAGHSETVCYAMAWAALSFEGYEEQNGVFKRAETDSFSFTCEIEKALDDQQLVYGWASVVEENGVPVVDYHGDMIDVADLVKAAHGFITDHRVSKVMHDGEPVGKFVESMVFTKEVQKALGIDLKKVGWFVGLQVESKAIWKMVKDGTLPMFSIGGRAKRVDNV